MDLEEFYKKLEAHWAKNDRESKVLIYVAIAAICVVVAFYLIDCVGILPL